MITAYYNVMTGRSYALRFALSSIEDRFFYTAIGEDCTNFISQCVWAAYGGYLQNSDEQTKENIKNGVRMVNGVWKGGLKWQGGTASWENATMFGDYVGSQLPYSFGPNAQKYNDQRSYRDFPANQIQIGDVLQFKDSSNSDPGQRRYSHSVYVTNIVSTGLAVTYNDVLVCQHTDDQINLPVTDIIPYKGGNDCYMRVLRFRQGLFDN